MYTVITKKIPALFKVQGKLKKKRQKKQLNVFLYCNQ